MRAIVAVAKTIMTGLLAILPVILTFALISWLASYIAAYIGPGSWFGARLRELGEFVWDARAPYIIGLVIVLLTLYLIGVIVQSRLRTVWSTFFDETIGRLPLIGTIFKTIKRFVQLLERRDDVDVKSMSPVWCFFSDERRTAVLGLMPSDEVVQIDGSDYRIVMVPTAPVPFGGGLFFLPAEWVRPAEFGVEGLTNIYVSMGVTAPDYMRRIRQAKDTAPQVVKPRQSETPPPGVTSPLTPRTADDPQT